MTDIIEGQGPRLLRAEDVYRPRVGRSRAEWAFQQYPPVFDVDRERPDLAKRGELARAVSVKAEVNHGRWVARCPFCTSAQVVTPADARFLCAGADGCANGPVRGAFVPIVFPSAQEQIEAALLARPNRETRNWTARETVDDLIEENAAHGLD